MDKSGGFIGACIDAWPRRNMIYTLPACLFPVNNPGTDRVQTGDGFRQKKCRKLLAVLDGQV